jgi:hypothetical protein
MVCPFANVQVSDQPVRAVVPVFLIVIVAPKVLELCAESM